MRTILLVLCILSVTLSAKAQFGKRWAAGNYYDTLGHKTAGFISWKAPEKLSKKPADHLFFKSNEKAGKNKIETSQLRSFTMGKDSFVVSQLKELNYAPVLQVVMDKPIKLYYWSAEIVNLPFAVLGAVGGALAGGTVISGMSSGKAYFYGQNCNELNTLTNKNFVDVMCNIMADKPDVVEIIKTKRFKLKDIDDLLTYYNTGLMPKKSQDDIY